MLVPAGNSEAVGGALERLLVDDDLAKRLGEKSRERATQLFSTAQIVPQYEALYRRVLANR